MNKLSVALLAAALVTGAAFAQAPATGTVKAIQPGLFEVAGPRVNEVMAANITKVSAAPGTGKRAISVETPWGVTYFGWPKSLKQVPFTIVVGKPAGSATISAPGFTKENAEDYKAAITAIVPYAVARAQDQKTWSERAGG